jgi:hypothetical protein
MALHQHVFTSHYGSGCFKDTPVIDLVGEDAGGVWRGFDDSPIGGIEGRH